MTITTPPPVAPPAGGMVATERGVSPIALALLAVWIGSGVALGLIDQLRGLFTFIFVISGWVLAVAVHEFGHAWVAHKAGDTTVEGRGYLTLNPMKYTNVVMSIVIPVAIVAMGGIGFPGGAVYLRQDLMRSRSWRAASSLAGPGGTLLVLIVLSGLVAIVRPLNPGSGLIPALSFLAFLQATALILNLLPVPGFDGYGALRPFLPLGLRRVLAPIEGLAVMAFIVLLFWSSLLSSLLFGAAFSLIDLLGVSPDAAIDGLRTFQFWK